MLKKTLLAAVIISQLATSCNSDDSSSSDSSTLSEQVAEILKKPYSDLTPDKQKLKLETEANEMLTQMDKSKTSGAIEAIENLGNLLDISTVDIFNGKNDNEIEEILKVSDVYGIYTWNNTQQKWDITASTTELKFIFPAKKGLTTTNAVLSSKSTSSTVKVKIVDTDEDWTYNPNTNTETYIPAKNDEIFLPTSVNATLTIDGKLAATFDANAKYSGDTPDESSFKMFLSDGYTWEISGKKAAGNNIAKSSFTYNGKNLLEFNSGSTANIDELLKEDPLVKYQGTANGLITLMDNFVIVADMDIVGLTKDEEALENTLANPDWNKATYYTDLNTYKLKKSQGEVAANNKNVKLILVSKKDGTKIADVIQRSEKGYSDSSYDKWVTSTNSYGGYWTYDPNGGAVIQNYDSVSYLKFNDNTEVEMSVYFSTGFEDFETKFEDFLKAFER